MLVELRPPHADAPPFVPTQVTPQKYVGENVSRDHKIPIWIPSTRVLVDTVP